MRATAEDGVPPGKRLPRDVWELDVDVDSIDDVSDAGTIAALGLPSIHPSQAQWPEYQAVGAGLWQAGAHGVLAPSAAHVGHQVLCVFRTTPAVPGVVEASAPTTHDVIPLIPTGLRT